MINVDMKLHRHILLSDIQEQKLFVLLKINPVEDITFKRQPFRIVFAVDTSGSMRDYTDTDKKCDELINESSVALPKKTKIDVLVEYLINLFDSQIFKNGDKLAIVQFNDAAKVLVPFTDAENKEVLIDAVKNLKECSGGTNTGLAMKTALELFSRENGNGKMFLLTDGITFDEDLTLEMSEEFAKNKIPVITIGIGNDWNFNFINLLADRTGGKVLYALSDNGNAVYPPYIKGGELTNVLISELNRSADEIFTNIILNINTIKGVDIKRISKVYPVQTELNLSRKPYLLGNAEARDITVFLIEISVFQNSAGKVRLAQFNLTYEVGGIPYRQEGPIIDVTAEFVKEYDHSLNLNIDNEVMQYVQQRNLSSMADRISEESKTNINKAVEILKAAMQSVGVINNIPVMSVLNNAVNELKNKKTISESTLAALKVGVKTHTIKYGQEIFTDEEIKKITGI